jgi:hypothetical protein
VERTQQGKKCHCRSSQTGDWKLTSFQCVHTGKLAWLQELHIHAIESAHNIEFAEYFAAELEDLAALAADRLVEIAPGRIDVTARGRLLVRTVAMAFDRFLRTAREPVRYSRVI